jgi:hypothetical protein
MITPPKPTFTSLWLTLLQRYEFVPVVADVRQLGLLVDEAGQRYSIVVAAGAEHGTCVWGLTTGEPKASYLITRDIYNALRPASLDTSEAANIKGELYYLQASFSGEAELVRATVETPAS